MFTDPEVTLALRRAAEHALEMRQMLAGLPTNARLSKDSPHTVGELAQQAAAVGWQVGEACRLMGETQSLAQRALAARG